MKLKAMVMTLGLFVAGSAMATDYSVSIANLGKGVLGGGSAINLYATQDTGIELVESYVLPQDDFTGKRAEPLTFAINPAHSFVYAAYSGPNQPVIVGLKITPKGLVYEWQHELATGDGGLQFTTLTAGADYVIENTYPVRGLVVHILDQAGSEMLVDATPTSNSPYTVLSGYVDPTTSLYYSCRSADGSLPATSVSIYAFEHGVDVSAETARPVAKSTSSTYLQGVCNESI
jgi:hypothetical protein